MRIVSMRWIAAALCCVSLMTMSAGGQAPKGPGLLFYLSGDRGLTADVAAGGDPQPNFASGVQVIPDGAKGPGLQCAHTQLLSYWAPGNIYAAARHAVVLLAVARAGRPDAVPALPRRLRRPLQLGHGVAAHRLQRQRPASTRSSPTPAWPATRVSYTMPAFPAPNQWVHLALSWDETRGHPLLRERPARRQGGRHGRSSTRRSTSSARTQRIISPYQVQSAYNFVRGGDIDEVRIYDRMLSDENVAALATGRRAGGRAAAAARPRRAAVARRVVVPLRLEPAGRRAAAARRHASVSIRKVEIHDVYDLKRWWWKGTDGIRETTWPGVYNRSRLPGRNDYFQLPDWDCYSLSGKSVTLHDARRAVEPDRGLRRGVRVPFATGRVRSSSARRARSGPSIGWRRRSRGQHARVHERRTGDAHRRAWRVPASRRAGSPRAPAA